LVIMTIVRFHDGLVIAHDVVCQAESRRNRICFKGSALAFDTSSIHIEAYTDICAQLVANFPLILSVHAGPLQSEPCVVTFIDESKVVAGLSVSYIIQVVNTAIVETDTVNSRSFKFESEFEIVAALDEVRCVM